MSKSGEADSYICPFCLISDNRIIAEGDTAYAIRDGFPVADGHTLVIPRRHAADWWELTEVERRDMSLLVDAVRLELMTTVHPDGFNVGFNAGRAAGQTVFHAHVHVIPRYLGDVPEPRGGVRHVIPHRAWYQASDTGDKARRHSSEVPDAEDE